MKLSDALRKGAEKVEWRQAEGMLFEREDGTECLFEDAHAACASGCIRIALFETQMNSEERVGTWSLLHEWEDRITIWNDYEHYSLEMIADWLEEQGE